MRKVLVTGNIGSGKTTLCKKLSAIFDLPAYHFDQIVWKENWQRPSQKERATLTKQLIKRKEWIVDGVSEHLMDAADVIVFLDFPRWICAWRTLKRNIKCFFQTRSEMPSNCPDYKVIPFIVRIIWNFKRKQNPWILEIMENTKKKKQVFHVCNNKELQKLLMYLNESTSQK